jgi:hypothetical protein
MKNVILLSAITLIITSLFFGSCTKEVLKEVRLTDTIKINTNVITHDTVKFITGMDSVKADFALVVSYQKDSMTFADLKAYTSSKNVPSNATYTWVIDGNVYTETNKSFILYSFVYSQNGTHLLSMSINCPDTKKVYSVVKSFVVKLKG